MHWAARGVGAVGVALVLLLQPAPAPAAPLVRAAAPPHPGTPDAGDVVFPLLGNGGYTPRRYVLDLTYRADTRVLEGTVTMLALAAQPLSRFDLDSAGPAIGGVRVDGRRASFEQLGEKLTITPPAPIANHAGFEVAVDFSVDPRERPGGGAPAPNLPTGFIPTDDGFVLAGQPNTMHTVFPCDDHPSDKAEFVFHLTVPDGLTAVANGVLAGSTGAGGRTTFTYRPRDPIAPELVQIAIGDDAVVDGTGPGGLPLRSVVPRDEVALLRPAIDAVPSHLAFLEDLLGPYPFDTYGVLASRATFGFSLETQTMSLFQDALLARITTPARAAVMVHELAHQWFGDSVAPRTWSDIWLNEGQATWYEYLWRAANAGLALDQLMLALYSQGDVFRQQYGPVARPPTPKVLFAQQRYGGGALVLYALRQVVGAETFQEIERAWVARHRNGVAGTADFIDLAAQLSGDPPVPVAGAPDLRAYLADWLLGSRTPPMAGHPDWTVTPAPAASTPAASGSA